MKYTTVKIPTKTIELLKEALKQLDMVSRGNAEAVNIAILNLILRVKTKKIFNIEEAKAKIDGKH